MRALVVYESMYGNTHHVATAIGEGLASGADVRVVPVADVAEHPSALDGVDLLVAGGPTHVHGMSRASTREAAVAAADEHDWLTLDEDGAAEGLREWFAAVGDLPVRAAAFDTRRRMSPVLSGRASKGIDKLLRRHGADVVAGATSFFVTDHDELEAGEEDRAREWGVGLLSLG